MKVSTTIELTGEVLEFDPSNEADLVEAYRLCSEYEKSYKALKQKLAKLAEPYIGHKGTSEPINGYMFRHMVVQRKTYDKAVLRQVFEDEDLLEQFLIPDKTTIDDYLKEHLEEIGENSHLLRESMVPVGNPYSVTKLEKVS